MLPGITGILEAHHARGGPGVVAGGAHHMLAGDAAFRRANHPLAPVGSLDCVTSVRWMISAPRMRAPCASAMVTSTGAMVTVGRVPQGADQAVHGRKRPQVRDLVDAYQAAVDADGLGRALVVAILVHPVAVAGEAQVARRMEADRLSGLSSSRLYSSTEYWCSWPTE